MGKSLITNNRKEYKIDLITLPEWREHYQELLTEARPSFMEVNYDVDRAS